MLEPLQILPSTTSHKREPLAPTLDVFARLGFRDLDLNLNHMIERGVAIDDVRRTLSANGQRAPIVSGGWCDFFDAEPRIQETLDSVERQVAAARTLGARMIRLFFGRLGEADYSAHARATIAANIRRVVDRHRDLLFVFENHDGAASRPAICREVLEHVDRPNARLNFDPINFEHRGVRSADALRILSPFIAHVHLKGYAAGEFCEFGAGDVDLLPVLETLMGGGYQGGFTVEYEGAFDRTLRLYLGVCAAQSAIDRLRAPA